MWEKILVILTFALMMVIILGPNLYCLILGFKKRQYLAMVGRIALRIHQLKAAWQDQYLVGGYYNQVTCLIFSREDFELKKIREISELIARRRKLEQEVNERFVNPEKYFVPRNMPRLVFKPFTRGHNYILSAPDRETYLIRGQ